MLHEYFLGLLFCCQFVTYKLPVCYLYSDLQSSVSASSHPHNLGLVVYMLRQATDHFLRVFEEHKLNKRKLGNVVDLSNEELKEVSAETILNNNDSFNHSSVCFTRCIDGRRKYVTRDRVILFVNICVAASILIRWFYSYLCIVLLYRRL